jgi:hypothetical protein
MQRDGRALGAVQSGPVRSRVSPIVLSIAGIVVLVAACADDVATVQPLAQTLLAAVGDALIPLPDGRVVGEREGVLVALDPRRPMLAPVTLGAADGVGELRAVTTLDGAIVALTTTGTFVLRGDAWLPSPLGDALDGPIVDAAVLPARTLTAQPELWISTATSLYRVRDGVARRLALEGDFARANLAAGARGDTASLWVRLPDRVLELWTDAAGALRTARLVLPSQPSALGADAAGVLWLVLDGGLVSLGADRRLVEHGVSVSRVLTSAQSDVAWFVGDAGRAWLHADGRLHEVRGDVSVGPRALLGVDGALYTIVADGAGGSSALVRHAPRHDVVIDGPADGAVVVMGATYAVDVLGAANPRVVARVADASLPVAQDPLRVTISEDGFDDGVYGLSVEVAFDDGTLPFRARRTFELISTASWAADIEPLQSTHCAPCHGAAGPAVTRLASPADWAARIADVRANVETGRMPLGRAPLSQRQIALFEAWEYGGFRE